MIFFVSRESQATAVDAILTVYSLEAIAFLGEEGSIPDFWDAGFAIRVDLE